MGTDLREGLRERALPESIPIISKQRIFSLSGRGRSGRQIRGSELCKLEIGSLTPVGRDLLAIVLDGSDGLGDNPKEGSEAISPSL